MKALKIDPTLAEAHRSLAFSRFVYEWDWQGAEQEFIRAIRLNPDSPTAHSQYAVLLGAMGRLDQAREQGRRALELDPLSPIIRTAKGMGHAREIYQRLFGPRSSIPTLSEPMLLCVWEMTR